MMELDSLAVDSSVSDYYRDIMQGQHIRAVRTHYREDGNQMPVLVYYFYSWKAPESLAARKCVCVWNVLPTEWNIYIVVGRLSGWLRHCCRPPIPFLARGKAYWC